MNLPNEPNSQYREGDWFVVPLRNGGYARGLVARAHPDNPILLGYFFSPKWRDLPALESVKRLTQDDAILVRRFGDGGIIDGSWPILGVLEGWTRQKWPLPAFGRYEELSGHSFRVHFDENDLSLRTQLVHVSRDELERLPSENTAGPGAIEMILTKLLG